MQSSPTQAVLMMMVGLVVLAADVGGQPRSAASAVESVVVPIAVAADRYEEAVGSGLGQRLEELRAVLADSGARVREALEVAQRDGSVEANLGYETVVSKELELVQEALAAVGAERQGVEAGQRELSEQLARVRDGLVHRSASLTRETRLRDSAVEQLKTELFALAEKHRTHVDNDEPLPPEDDLRARALASQLQLARQRAALARRGGKDAEARLARLRGFEGRLAAAGSEYGLVFDRADGQVRLLAEVAEMRREGVEVAAVVGELNRVGQQLAAVDATLVDTAMTLDALLDAPLLDDQVVLTPVDQTVRRQSGLNILRKVLGDAVSKSR